MSSLGRREVQLPSQLKLASSQERLRAPPSMANRTPHSPTGMVVAATDFPPYPYTEPGLRISRPSRRPSQATSSSSDSPKRIQLSPTKAPLRRGSSSTAPPVPRRASASVLSNSGSDGSRDVDQSSMASKIRTRFFRSATLTSSKKPSPIVIGAPTNVVHHGSGTEGGPTIADCVGIPRADAFKQFDSHTWNQNHFLADEASSQIPHPRSTRPDRSGSLSARPRTSQPLAVDTVSKPLRQSSTAKARPTPSQIITDTGMLASGPSTAASSPLQTPRARLHGSHTSRASHSKVPRKRVPHCQSDSDLHATASNDGEAIARTKERVPNAMVKSSVDHERAQSPQTARPPHTPATNHRATSPRGQRPLEPYPRKSDSPQALFVSGSPFDSWTALVPHRRLKTVSPRHELEDPLLQLPSPAATIRPPLLKRSSSLNTVQPLKASPSFNDLSPMRSELSSISETQSREATAQFRMAATRRAEDTADSISEQMHLRYRAKRMEERRQSSQARSSGTRRDSPPSPPGTEASGYVTPLLSRSREVSAETTSSTSTSSRKYVSVMENSAFDSDSSQSVEITSPLYDRQGAGPQPQADNQHTEPQAAHPNGKRLVDLDSLTVELSLNDIDLDLEAISLDGDRLRAPVRFVLRLGSGDGPRRLVTGSMNLGCVSRNTHSSMGGSSRRSSETNSSHLGSTAGDSPQHEIVPRWEHYSVARSPGFMPRALMLPQISPKGTSSPKSSAIAALASPRLSPPSKLHHSDIP